MRATLGLALCLGLIVSSPTSSGAADGRATTPATKVPADSGRSFGEASAQAKSSGAPVEVTSETTETNLVLAQPDGTFELEAHREAVRTDIHGDWEPIDTHLVVKPDGTIEPAAITLPVAFADGGAYGDTPIVTAGRGDESLAFGWDEGPLPEPVVDGDQVTYPEIRPGVDLVFTANPSGFSDAVVVKSSAAAANLVQDPIEFTGTSSGLDLATTSDGTLLATNGEGDTTLSSPPPIAWDSSGGGQGVNRPAADNIGTGELHDLAVPDVTASDASPESSVTLEVAPPLTAVQDPDTVYPLYLDPQFTGRYNTRFRTMHSGGWNYGTPSTDVMRVGYCDWSGCNDSFQRNARSFFEFDVSALTVDGGDPVVLDARVQAQQVWNADSAAQPVQLRRTTRAFTNGDNYPGPSGSSLQQISSAAGHNNNPGWLTFDNTSVAAYIEDETAGSEHSEVSFALSAPSENNKYYWKKFSNDTKLSVVFGYPPRITSYTVTNDVACPGEAVHSRGSLDVKVTAESVYGSPEMNFAAQVFDNDADNDGPWDATTLTKSTGWNNNGSNYTWTSVGVLDDLPYGRHAWKASIKTEIGALDANGDPYPGIMKNTDPATRPFIVDDVKPQPASLSSDDYPRDYWGRADNSPGTITVAVPSGATGGVAFGFDKAPPKISNTTCGYTTAGFKPASSVVNGVINLPVPSDLDGGLPHTLTVYTFDKAHNESAPVTYPFYVSPGLDGTTTTNRVEVENNLLVKEAHDVTVAGEIAPSATPAPGKSLTLTATDPSAYIDFKLSFTQPGYYALGAKLTSCSTCGEARFSMPGAQVGPDEREAAVNASEAATTGLDYVQIGGYAVELDAAGATTRTVRIRFPQATATAPSTLKIDYLTVAQIQAGTYGSPTGTLPGNLSEAFNNRGIATEGGIGGFLEYDKDAVPPQPQRALSAQKLQAIGIVQGQNYSASFTPPGATDPVSTTFAIPTATAEGDNVIAAGQKIQVPTDISSSLDVDHVDFLVAATCGNVARDPRTQFGLKHQPSPSGPSVTTNYLLPFASVPNWRSPATASLSPITASGSVQGASATPVAGSVSLYVLEIDVNEDRLNDPLTEITLPTTGASLTRACTGRSQLHVFAVTTRGGS